MSFFDYGGTDLIVDHWDKPSVMRHTHLHMQYEIYFCPENVYQESVINGVKYSYKYPCAILSTPYTVHSMSCGSDEKSYNRYVFYFGNKTLNAFNNDHLPKDIFKRTTGLLFKLSEKDAQMLLPLAVMCHDSRSLAERELTLALFVNRLLSCCSDEDVIKVGTQSFYIQDVLQYIFENCGKELNSDDISRRFAVSRSKLDRDFKKFTGKTVHGYVEICRFNRAIHLLKSREDMSIGEIAAQCGFESETYFFPFFKKKMGITPAEYRKRAK